MRTISLERGFTLLEMLIALTVFAVVSAMVYGGQVAILNAKESTERQAVFLKQLQTSMLMMERDIAHHVLRPVRDEFGDQQAALKSEDFGAMRLRLTRAGWQNPLNLPRSTLQRVAYGIEDDKLYRYSWPMLDRVQGSEPDKLELLANVKTLKLRYLDREREWQEQWPPQSNQQKTVQTMPLAVELILELEEWGSYRRLIPTVGGGVDYMNVAVEDDENPQP